jgi:hypothetical protein
MRRAYLPHYILLSSKKLQNMPKARENESETMVIMRTRLRCDSDIGIIRHGI